MGKKLLSAVIAISMTASLSAPAFAMGVDRSAQMQVQQSTGVDKVGCFRKWNGNVVCNGGGGGGAAAAGLIGGLAVGAIVGGAIASSQAQANANAQAAAANANSQQAANYQNWMNYCSGKYRSFDPQSGTYLGADGMRHPCQ